MDKELYHYAIRLPCPPDGPPGACVDTPAWPCQLEGRQCGTESFKGASLRVL